MIFYGTNGKHFATLPLPYTACPACRRTGQLQVSLVSRYAHVYWVPFVPYQKIAVAECLACHASWEPKALPAELAPAVQELKKQTAHPYWTWSGLGLMGLFLVGAYFLGIRNGRQDDANLLSPRAGDVYTVHSDSSHQYSLLRVRRVSGNSVELLANNYQTDNSSPFPDLDQDSSYSPEPFVLTRLDLQIMRKKGELTDVDRP